jgi:sec-independent protein translocase protein TatA
MSAWANLPVALFGGGVGYSEVIVILFVLLLVFGRRLPEVGRSLGRGLSEFKKGLKGVEDEIESSDEPKKNDKKESATAAEPPGSERPRHGDGPKGELKG